MQLETNALSITLAAAALLNLLLYMQPFSLRGFTICVLQSKGRPEGSLIQRYMSHAKASHRFGLKVVRCHGSISAVPVVCPRRVTLGNNITETIAMFRIWPEEVPEL